MLPNAALPCEVVSDDSKSSEVVDYLKPVPQFLNRFFLILFHSNC